MVRDKKGKSHNREDDHSPRAVALFVAPGELPVSPYPQASAKLLLAFSQPWGSCSQSAQDKLKRPLSLATPLALVTSFSPNMFAISTQSTDLTRFGSYRENVPTPLPHRSNHYCLTPSHVSIILGESSSFILDFVQILGSFGSDGPLHFRCLIGRDIPSCRLPKRKVAACMRRNCDDSAMNLDHSSWELATTAWLGKTAVKSNIKCQAMLPLT